MAPIPLPSSPPHSCPFRKSASMKAALLSIFKVASSGAFAAAAFSVCAWVSTNSGVCGVGDQRGGQIRVFDL